MTVWPKRGASDTRTERGTVMSSVSSGKWPRTSAGDVAREVRPPVVHREDDRRDVDRGVEVLLDHLDGADELRQALERVVLALNRDEHLARDDHGVEGQRPRLGGQSMKT